MARKNGEVFALADLQRLTGRLLLKTGSPREAREAFEEAIATARRQGARLYLLRAARDLAQILAEDGDPTPRVRFCNRSSKTSPSIATGRISGRRQNSLQASSSSRRPDLRRSHSVHRA